jgi:hypothetical protein
MRAYVEYILRFRARSHEDHPPDYIRLRDFSDAWLLQLRRHRSAEKPGSHEKETDGAPSIAQIQASLQRSRTMPRFT